MKIRTALGILAAALVLAACEAPPANGPAASAVQPAPAPIGDFKIGHFVVIADDVVQGPASRDATPDEIEAAIKAAVEPRLRAYTGEKFYNIGVRVGAYALAQPGIPIIASPKSGLGIDVTFFDDARQAKINEDPQQFLIIEEIGGSFLIGSGHTMTREEQLAGLARQFGDQLIKFMTDNPGMFGG